MAGPPPRYGTWVMRAPVPRFTASIVRWLVVPVPDEPIRTASGLARAQAMSAGKSVQPFRRAVSAFTTQSSAPMVMAETGARSRCGSKGRLR